MDELGLHQILQEMVHAGVVEVCVCSGKRNAALVLALDQFPQIKKYSWFEERSAAFFALGRARATERPVAVLTTSGTAVGECLPAMMEAYYSGAPLLMVSADRPKCFRGTGAPQSAEQKGIFGPYVLYEQDIEEGEPASLEDWSQRGPAHLNVCLEEIQNSHLRPLPEIDFQRIYTQKQLKVKDEDVQKIDEFFEKSRRPLVIVGTLEPHLRCPVEKFLNQWDGPAYCESTSGLRRLRSFEGYDFDAVFRIGGVPTCRLWRDLENKDCPVCSVTEHPFSGLPNSGLVHTSLAEIFSYVQVPESQISYKPDEELFFDQFPQAEPSLFHSLSHIIAQDARVYLGNSLPIREWDLASQRNAATDVWANRGVNGIDGQLSSFLGLCHPQKENWAILGDLTTLYDMAAPWILSYMELFTITIVVINNGGGMIFNRFGLGSSFINPHGMSFKHFAKMWGLDYAASLSRGRGHRLIELVPDDVQTEEFWKRKKLVSSGR